MIYEVTLTKGNVTLTLFVNSELASNPNKSGYLTIEDTVDKDNYIVDNLNYIIDIDKERKEEIKGELKSMDQYYKGVIKDIKSVVKEAIRMKLI